jgi:putative ABC transport system permease protein
LNNRYNQNLQGDATLQYFNDFVKDHQKNVILNSLEVSMPFVVIGSGITADFTYPIFDIEHSNPNPTKECIIFGNSHAYNRMFDAYRGNFTENYLVGSFNAGVNRSQILATMNEEATTVMS